MVLFFFKKVRKTINQVNMNVPDGLKLLRKLLKQKNVKSTNNFFVVKKQQFLNHKMSLSGNEVLENSTQNGSMSKRDKKKFEQVLKQIAASENTDSKSHKKRRNPTERRADPQARKLIKTESQFSDGKNQEGSSSVREVSEDDSKIQKISIKRQIKDLHNVYNKKYGIPEESEGFSDYMVNYTYGQKSKYIEKECQDWQVLSSLGGKKIEIRTNENDQQKTRSINEKLSNEREKVQELFSKNNREFIKKVLGQLLIK